MLRNGQASTGWRARFAARVPESEVRNPAINPNAEVEPRFGVAPVANLRSQPSAQDGARKFMIVPASPCYGNARISRRSVPTHAVGMR